MSGNWQVNKAPPTPKPPRPPRGARAAQLVQSIAVVTVAVCVFISQDDGDHPTAKVIAYASLVVGFVAFGAWLMLDRRDKAPRPRA